MTVMQKKSLISTRRLVVSTAGVYAGLLGVEHGYFETLQGNVELLYRCLFQCMTQLD